MEGLDSNWGIHRDDIITNLHEMEKPGEEHSLQKANRMGSEDVIGNARCRYRGRERKREMRWE